jgi:hypothetical protein
MAAYTPHPWIVKFHDINRLGPGGAAESNTFTPDWQTTDGKAYLEGVLYTVAGILALAALVAIVFGITYPVGCCCPCRKGRGPLYNWCGVRGVYVLLSLATTCMLIGPLVFVGKVNTGLADTVDAMQNLNGILGNASTLLSGPIVGGFNDMVATAAAMQTAAQSQSAPPQVQATIASFLAAATTADGQAASAASSLNATATNLGGNFLNGGRLDLDAARHGVSIGGWVLMGLAALWALLMTATLRKTRCAAVSFKVMSTCTYGAGVLVIILLGLFYAVALVGSDVCYDPSAAVTRVLNVTNASPDAAATLEYYTQCGAPNSTLAPEGAYASALDAVARLQTASADLASVQSAIDGSSGALSYLSPYVASLNTSVLAVTANSTVLTASIACAPLNAVWGQLETGMCSEGVFFVILTTLLLAASSALFVLLLSFGAALIFHHPGDVPAGGAGAPLVGKASTVHNPVVGRAPQLVTPGPAHQVVLVPAGSASAYAGPAGGRDWN